MANQTNQPNLVSQANLRIWREGNRMSSKRRRKKKARRKHAANHGSRPQS